MSYWHDEDTINFSGELEPHSVMNYVTEFFDYDHVEGRLRWTHDRRMWEQLPSSMKRGAQQGNVAGNCRKGYDYEIKIGGYRRNALPMVWEHQTSDCSRRVMTIKPGEDKFCIDNLCRIPKSKRRAPKFRAKGLNVVSWSYENKKFTVVAVDSDYNKQVLSYHDDIDSALEALDNPVVSFL